MRKGGSFFEKHIEKLVLIVAAVIAVFVMLKWVLVCPSTVTFEGETFRPGQIDPYIHRDTDTLRAKLQSAPQPKAPYEPRIDDFLANMKTAVRDLDLALAPPKPKAVEVALDRKFAMPSVPPVEGVDAEHIRAVAYVPLKPITLDNVGDETVYHPNDIDLVTVQGEFDVQTLLDGFHECFAGSNLPDKWRDPCLAQPVFASVQLQRQRLLKDGTWSEWEVVPRPKTDPQADLFAVAEDADQLPAGGIKVQLLKFEDPQIRASLLQPEAYQIASAEEEWFPPQLHRTYAQKMRDIEKQERLDARAAQIAEKEQEQEERGRSRTDRRQRTTARTTTSSPTATSPMSGGPGDDMAIMQMLYGGGAPGSSSSRQTTTRRRSRTDRRSQIDRQQDSRPSQRPAVNLNEVYEKYNELLIGDTKNLHDFDEPIVFWAHDDRVEPDSTYRYRMRLGVFNPVAGTSQIVAEQSEYRDKVILWSDFSEVTSAIDVPSRMYFFPIDVVQEAAKAVKVQVAKYALGYWYSNEFIVKPGETIGETAVPEISEDEEQAGVTVPEQIDYNTGAVLVDLVPVNDWSGQNNLKTRYYFDMLYSRDANEVERMPVRLMNWPDEVRYKYAEIRNLAKKEKEPFNAWASTRGMRRGPRRAMPTSPTTSPLDMGDGTMTPDELMMMMMMQGGGPPMR